MEKDSNQPAPDIILRSAGGKMFYSWKTILSISSPVFSDMFTLPQPDASTSNNIEVHEECPVVDLPEDSPTLERILSLCHPPSCSGKQFKIENVHELRAVVEAATKYDMENIRSIALDQLTNPSILREDPVRIYVLACQYKHHESARLAVKHTLALPTLLPAYMPELEKIHAGQLCRVILYRERCIAVARPLADDHTWIEYTSRVSPLFGCDDDENCNFGTTTIRHPPSRKYRSGRPEKVTVHTWWLDYMEKAGHALQKSPHGEAVKDEKLVDEVMAEISSSKCGGCEAYQVRKVFRSFVDDFAEEVERRIAEVEIELEF